MKRCLGALVVAWWWAAAEVVGKRPNIVAILSDDHAVAATEGYDSIISKFVHSPNISSLATDGVLFEQVVVENPICSPARATFLTGQFSYGHRVASLQAPINEESKTWPEALRESGYETAMVGKWHLGSPSHKFFDFTASFKFQGKWFDTVYSVKGRKSKRYRGYTSDTITDIALEWLDSVKDSGKPFAINVWYKAPHATYEYPREYNEYLGHKTKFPTPSTLKEKYHCDRKIGCSALSSGSHLTSQMQGFYFGGPGKNAEYFHKRAVKDRLLKWNDVAQADDEETRGYYHMLTKYLRCIRAMDTNIGRILLWLEKNQLADNTLVIYTTDQGYFLGEHGLIDKRLILDPSVRIPLIMRFPKVIPRLRRVKALAQNTDIGPTILDLVGVKIPRSMHGQSMSGLARGLKKAEKRWNRKAQFVSYYQSDPLHHGVRNRALTYARVVKNRDTLEIAEELYDNKNDPDQTTNIAESPKKFHKQLLVQGRKLLKETMSEIGMKNYEAPGVCPSYNALQKCHTLKGKRKCHTSKWGERPCMYCNRRCVPRFPNKTCRNLDEIKKPFKICPNSVIWSTFP